ncbi:BBF_collapsed_G0033800.mRNA.1.CDS.1 [Saccharomyces cerevisiae]|nr:BFH_HP2_G0032680.mRNA.1.CDS.1 [Saccharomyces cerevisiae]CAI6618366.1 BFH_HP2_G0032680.mRNA.1.CDS.1 [Saccharomyces cerevisiae]CAI7208192.1 BBF_collapsed_G0033800.mRNA.1.CDS.1 [Saccharomyces cerevisiae]
MLVNKVIGLLGVLFATRFTNAVELDLDNYESLQNATSLIAYGLMDYYTGNQYGKTVGMFSDPYYWWEAGGAWGCMLDYWFFMDNDTYNDEIIAAMIHQAGDDNDYIPLNQSTTEGNDDQAFWGIAAMTAAERNFTNPPENEPQWLYLAQAVFNTMALRWDADSCGGGLRWQIFVWNSGYDYKNTVSNGALFHIAARLARYTGNQTYVDWAEKVYEWMVGVNLISNGTYKYVYDGVSIDDNCTKVTSYQWTYNQGLLLAGSAYLYNFTGSDLWHTRTKEFLNASQVFFHDGIVYEAACQGPNTCNTDQRSFKAYFARFLGVTAQLVPETRNQIMSWLNTSAIAAAKSCSGGTDGHTCGLNWFNGTWDGMYGLGEQMSALEVMVNTRALDKPAPYTAENGGSSVGDGAAGTQAQPTNLAPLNITKGSKAGAGIITAVIGISIVACALWLVF